MDSIQSKVCTRCKYSRPLTDFSRRGSGWASWCKACHRVYRRENRDKINARQNEYREVNRERVREWGRRKSRRNLLAKYGLTEERYEQMVAAQSGKCAICKKAPDDNLCVDHCHETGRVRGLLCRKCNAALGAFGDSTELLRSAITYMELHADT